MRRARYLARMALEVVRYGTADRHYGLILVILLAAIILALSLAVQTVAPLALYPFV